MGPEHGRHCRLPLVVRCRLSLHQPQRPATINGWRTKKARGHVFPGFLGQEGLSCEASRGPVFSSGPYRNRPSWVSSRYRRRASFWCRRPCHRLFSRLSGRRPCHRLFCRLWGRCLCCRLCRLSGRRPWYRLSGRLFDHRLCCRLSDRRPFCRLWHRPWLHRGDRGWSCCRWCRRFLPATSSLQPIGESINPASEQMSRQHHTPRMTFMTFPF